MVLAELQTCRNENKRKNENLAIWKKIKGNHWKFVKLRQELRSSVCQIEFFKRKEMTSDERGAFVIEVILQVLLPITAFVCMVILILVTIAYRLTSLLESCT